MSNTRCLAATHGFRRSIPKTPQRSFSARGTMLASDAKRWLRNRPNRFPCSVNLCCEYPKLVGVKMRRHTVWLSLFFWCVLISAADAKCFGESYSMNLGQTVNVHRSSDGGKCTNQVNRSKDPIYGSIIVTRPKHGSLTSTGRTV